MRIESLNSVTGQTNVWDLPSHLNPVRIGCHPDNHVVLDHAYVGSELAAIHRDVANGGGWRIWNRNGRPFTAGTAVLTERNQSLPLRQRELTLESWPFVLHIRLSAEEFHAEEDHGERLDRAGSDLVIRIHRELLALHPHDSADRNEWLRDAYIHTLERQILALSATIPEFPASDLQATELGTHLARVSVRAELLRELGGTPEVLAEGGWNRFRHAMPELETALRQLVQSILSGLQLPPELELTERIDALDASFPAAWKKLTKSSSISPRFARYLALRRLIKEIKDIWYGLGPLEELLDDPGVSEIMVVNAERIFIEKRGRIERSGRRFLTDPIAIIQRILGKAHRQINTAQPLADARLADGSRVNGVIAPVALSGPCLTIRRFPQMPFDDAALIRNGSLTEAVRDFLRAAVLDKRNILISGGTGSGKTTLLNVLSSFIPNHERIVTIEDTAELRLPKDHLVTLQARPKNVEGTGVISIRDLVKNALRMRPDRIVVGECRGGEAIDMLQAMNTGHDGSLTTLHANSPPGAVDRLVVLVQQASDSDLPVESIHQQIVSAIDLIVQLENTVVDGRRLRGVTAISEVTGYDPDERAVRLTPLYTRTVETPLAPTGHLPSFLGEMINAGLVPDPVTFVRGEGFARSAG